MVAQTFEVGDLVWAKMKGYPPWPAEIIDHPNDSKVKKSHHYVVFFGYDNHAWIPDENISLHNNKLVEMYQSKKRSAIYQDAIKTIVEKSKDLAKYHKQNDSIVEKIKSENDTSRVHESSFDRIKETTPKSKTSVSEGSAKKDKKKMPPKKSAVFKPPLGKRSFSPDENGTLSPSKHMRIDGSKQENGYNDLHASLSYNTGDNTHAGLLGRSYIERAKTPDIDLKSKSSFLEEKHIVPNKQKIGFLGLGGLGKGIVKNLLQSGHSVTLWNRTTEKCKKFYDIGAEKASTPADVISSTDITFCCVSDPEAAKGLVFGNCGVLKGLEACGGGNRGFVEMTSMDPEASEAIGAQVSLRGGRYLEAPIHGSRVQAEEGTLLVIAAGDESLYEECISCFRAMSRHHMYIRSTVGDASKLNIIHSMLVGTVYATIAESLALLRRVNLEPADFLEMLKFGVLDSDVIIEKAQSMVNHMYVPNTRLKHIQRYLSLGLMMGSNVDQPTPITSAANEVYKHCKLLRFGDHDVSAVFEGIRGMLEK